MNGIRLTNEEAIARINDRCNELNYVFLGFDNEDNVYTNNKVKLKLHCNKCGSEWNTTSYEKFMSGRNGCPGCNVRRKIDEKEIIKQIKERCKELNYEFLGYSDGARKGKINTKIILKCNKCGEIWDTTTITNFLDKGRTSHTCGRKNPTSMPVQKRFEEKAIKNIKKRLEGSTLEFVSFDENGYQTKGNTKLIVHCSECGENSTISYQNIIWKNKSDIVLCQKCQYNGKVSNEEALEKIKHKCELLEYEFLGFNNPQNRYDGKNTRLILKCLKCGYTWNTTIYANFINQVIKCRGCTNNWHLERVVETTLKENEIRYEMQKKFKWMKNKIVLSLDFFLPDYDIGIECQGRQHFVPVEKYGGVPGFEDTKIRDGIKKKCCNEHGIKLLYFTELKKYDDFMGEKLIKTSNKLIENIKNHGRK